MDINKKEIVKELLTANKVQAILFYSPQNRYWFSRFHSSMGYLLVTKTESWLFLDGRYITMAREQQSKNKLQNVDHLEILDNQFWSKMQKILEGHAIEQLGFESDWTTYSNFLNWQTNLQAKTTLVPVNTEKIREVKDQWEIEQIQKACDITNLVFADTIKWVRPGISEKAVARYVSDCFLLHGAQKLSFDTIVASGVNGAKPHATPSEKLLTTGELVTLDMGCCYNEYVSDQTRTFSLGEITDKKLQEIYNTVYEAQTLGIGLLKPGVKTGFVHEKVAQFIEQKGYKGYFTHGLGHGMGIEIHEEPYESWNQQTILKPGMVVTVEPGIYIPDLGGVRIEDDFLITETGAKRLTSSVRELIEVKVE